MRACQSEEKPLGLQFILYETKCSFGLLYKLQISGKHCEMLTLKAIIKI